MEQSSVANWQIGRLELFFEGSWGQVCAGSFAAADANVACRSMGFFSGTIGPFDTNFNDLTRERLVYPEIAVTSLGCSGQEMNLLQCPGQVDIRGDDYNRYSMAGCSDDSEQALLVACVTAAGNGASIAPFSGDWSHWSFMRGNCLHLQMHLPQHANAYNLGMPLVSLHGFRICICRWKPPWGHPIFVDPCF